MIFHVKNEYTRTFAIVSWWIVTTLSLAFLFVGIPSYVNRIRPDCVFLFSQNYRSICVINLVSWQLIFAFIFYALSIVLIWYRSNDWMALVLAYVFVGIGATDTSLTDQVIQPIVDAGGWSLLVGFTSLLQAFVLVGGLSLLYLFPNGHFVPPWTKVLLICWTACNIIWLINPLLSQAWSGFPVIPLNPLTNAWRKNMYAAYSFHVSWFLTGIYAQIYRYFHEENYVYRKQVKWCLFGLFSAVLSEVIYYSISVFVNFGDSKSLAIFYTLSRFPLYVLLMVLFPISIIIAIFRHNLWSIDTIISHSLLYVVLTIILMSVYMLMVNTLGFLFQDSNSLFVSFISTGFIAIVFQPLRNQLQRSVNRLLYGERDEPYRVLTRLSQRLATTLAPDEVLPSIVTTIKESLNLQYVALALIVDEPDMEVNEHLANAKLLQLVSNTSSAEHYSANQGIDVVAANGTLTQEIIRMPLSYRGDLVGWLFLASRGLRETLNASDIHLLNDVAHQAGVAVQAVRLTRELQRARERLVLAREEERRRIRRDLHDGLGPALASQMFTIDTACLLLERDPATAARILRELKGHLQDAIVDIRRLVYDLRPPSLDDLGLIAALREQANRYAYSDVSIIFHTPDALPPLPAAVEVAIYRIVQEAVTNVVRHAQARMCTITLVIENTVLVTIEDDGCGIPSQYHAGVGLYAMRERTAELNGTIIIEGVEPHGTRICASLPFI